MTLHDSRANHDNAGHFSGHAACVGPLWTLGSEHCGHADRPNVDTEIGVMDSEIAFMDAEIGVVDGEIADRA